MVGNLYFLMSCRCLIRKKKGEMPTGIMAHIAKASGCTSVHDLLEKGSDMVAATQAILKMNGSDKVLLFYSVFSVVPYNPAFWLICFADTTVTNKHQGTKRSRETDAADKVAAKRDESVGIDLNAVPGGEGDENIGVDLNARPSVCIKKRRKLQHCVKKNPADERSHGGDSNEPLPRNESPDVLNNNIVLPRGTPVTTIAGAQLDNEDIGAAIQFLEFCRAFTEVVEVNK